MQSEELSPEELSSLLTSYMPEIPGYRVIRRIGKGGMSYVYLGVQISLDRQVAIKVMSPEALTDEKSKQRFEHEAHTIAKLEHPCIVGIHEVGRTSQGLLYYVLPYLARGHLGQRDFTNDEGRVAEVLRALLSALDYAHTRGIVHRDVKAENVLFDNADRPLLTDFGIALSRSDTSRITTAGLAVGSGGYMAPEQARGEVVDGRADLYSVGVLAFELLNGRLPFLSSDPLALALMHAQDPIPRLPVERKHWQAFLDRSLAKSADNRFRNAQQMLAALAQVSVRDRAASDDLLQPPVAPARIGRRPAWLAAGLAGAVILGTVMLLRSNSAVDAPNANDFFTGADATTISASTSQAGATGVVAADVGSSEAVEPKAVLPGAVASTATASVAQAELAVDKQAATAAETSRNLRSAAFAAVQSSVTVTSLEFDPAIAGARELHAARRQITQLRLSTPPGDNAIESVLSALRAGADPSIAAVPSDALISAFAERLAPLVRAGRDDASRKLYLRARQFAGDSGRLSSAAWAALQTSLIPPLVARLEASLASADSASLDRTKVLATALKIEAGLLEPAWSRPIPVPVAGKVLRSSGPVTVMVKAGSAGRPGVAFMRQEVSRSEYAAFAAATGRPAVRCRNRSAPISIKKRSWLSPGFNQSPSHPAVCVSFSDASAYAKWLSQRTGESYRLPTAQEWRLVSSYRSSGNGCADGHISCGQPGTVPAASGPQSPLGLSGVRGNAKEWSSDCEGNCRQRIVTGLGWRDNASRADSARTTGLEASTGFDDVGFRLVREIEAQ